MGVPIYIQMRKQSITVLSRRLTLASLLLAGALLSLPVGAQIPNSANAVNSNHIADNAVGSAQIADNAVGSAQIATAEGGEGGEGAGEMVASLLGASQIADNAVGTAQIENNSLNLFDGVYDGGPFGDDINAYVYPEGARLTPGSNPCLTTVLGEEGQPANLLARCGSDVNLPFNGTGAFNASRVLENNAITSNELTRDAIGYQNYIANGVHGGGRGVSLYADNGLNDSVFDDDSISVAHLSDDAATRCLTRSLSTRLTRTP